ncbi:MAG: NAD-dependent epimerase/dehydratase family protein [Salinispira sp.]
MITVIGGSGFIGSRLAKRLTEHKKQFRIVDIQQSARGYEVISADVRSADELSSALAGTSVIVNLAAEHKDNVTPVSLYTEVNVDGARNVCEAARRHDIQTIVFTSSVAVYSLSGGCTSENDTPEPFNEYGRTKLQAEQIYSDWQKEEPQTRRLIIVRPSVVFGEGNRGNVYNLLRQIISGFFMMVGNGRNRKSMSYVENIASFLEQCAHSAQPASNFALPAGIHLYNYADQPDMDMNEFVTLVRKEMGISSDFLRMPYWLVYMGGMLCDIIAGITSKKFAISAIRIKKFCANTQVASEKRKELPFTPDVSLPEGIRRTIADLISEGDTVSEGGDEDER